MRLKSLTLMTSLIASAGLAQAAPPAFQDARAFAMGGTGVAAGRPASATFYNPALLSIQHKGNQDDFNITLPSVNARLADDEDVPGQVDDLQQTIDEFNAAADSNNPAEARQSAEKLLSQLQALDQDAMRADVGLGLAIQKPGQALGVGIYASGTLRANVRGDFDEEDEQFLTGIIEGGPIENIESGDLNGRQLQSSGRIVAAAISEVGLTLSRQFNAGDNALALGITPKYVQLRTFDYERSVSDFEEDDFDAGEYETSKSTFNVDLGTAYTFGADKQWVAGASVRNLVPMDIRTVSGDEVEVNPLVTVGIAHRSNWHTLAVDLDLTKNEAFSFEDDSQWLSVGGEVDVFDSLQLRAGVRHNLAHNDDTSEGIAEKNQFTAGLALSPFGVRIEVSGLVGDGEVGGAAELGVMF